MCLCPPRLKKKTELTEKNVVLNKIRKHDIRETKRREVQELYYHLAIRGTKRGE